MTKRSETYSNYICIHVLYYLTIEYSILVVFNRPKFRYLSLISIPKSRLRDSTIPDSYGLATTYRSFLNPLSKSLETRATESKIHRLLQKPVRIVSPISNYTRDKII